MTRWRRSESLAVPRSEIAWGLLALFFPAVGRAPPVFARALPCLGRHRALDPAAGPGMACYLSLSPICMSGRGWTASEFMK